MSIGILSGMGAAAGAHFYSNLVKTWQRNGATKDSDFPEVVLYNFPFNGTDSNGVASVDHFLSDLQFGIQKLNDWGVECIVITCNTAHSYLNQIQSKAEILNMVDIVQNKLEGVKFGVLCSRTARQEDLYSKASYYLESESDQSLLDSIIQRGIIGRITETDTINLLSMVTEMLDRGADSVVLGCTELPMFFTGSMAEIYGTEVKECIIDAGSCVIEKLLERKIS